MTGRRAVSNILSMLLLIGLSVAGAGVYYLAVTASMRPEPQLSSQVTINVGASAFVESNSSKFSLFLQTVSIVSALFALLLWAGARPMRRPGPVHFTRPSVG